MSIALAVGGAFDDPVARESEGRNTCAAIEVMVSDRAEDSKGALPGTWGGQGAQLRIAETGAELELDCAHGSIPKPFGVDAEGRFEAAGVFVRENPGPVRAGSEPKSRPASYSGFIRDKIMTLKVTLTDSGETIGTYVLTHGSEGRVRKCR